MALDWFKFTPSLWLRDPRLVCLTRDQRCAVIDLACFMWENTDGSCSLPDEDKVIAGLLHVSEKTWKAWRKSLVDGFSCPIQRKDSRLSIDWLLTARAAAEATSTRQSNNRRSTTVEPRNNDGPSMVQPRLNGGGSMDRPLKTTDLRLKDIPQQPPVASAPPDGGDEEGLTAVQSLTQRYRIAVNVEDPKDFGRIGQLINQHSEHAVAYAIQQLAIAEMDEHIGKPFAWLSKVAANAPPPEPPREQEQDGMSEFERDWNESERRRQATEAREARERAAEAAASAAGSADAVGAGAAAGTGG